MALRGLLETANHALESKTPGKTLPSRRRHSSDVALAHYLAGLSHQGLGVRDKAKEQFELALQAEPDLVGAKIELATFR